MKNHIIIVICFIGSACGAELKWFAPATYSNGSQLPAGTITGYRIYNKIDGKYRLHASTPDTKIQVPDGTYAVAATYQSGQTGLSEPVTFPYWEASLEAPNAMNTVSPTTGRISIQACIAGLKPGGVLYFRGGEYKFSESGTFIDATASGNSAQYVTIRNYPGQNPVFVGIGWGDEDVGTTVAQTLLNISGNYVRVFGMKFRSSGRYGITVNGSFCWIEECEAYANWLSNIYCGIYSVAGNDVNRGTIIYCKAHHSRTGYGISLGLDDNKDYNADGWTIKRCLSYRNGYNDDNRINRFGGGNSDGTGCTKVAHDNYTSSFDWTVNGRANRIRNLHIVENLLFLNADDGADVSSGEGTLFAGNIAAWNGPSGTMGFKQLREHYETSTYAGNAAIGFRGSIFPQDTLYISALSSVPINSGDLITGVKSGSTGAVSSGFMFSNGNASQTWAASRYGVLYLSNVSGAFQAGEEIAVDGVSLAKVGPLGQTIGCDHRANLTDTTKPLGRNNEVAWTSLFHNPPGDGSLRGLSSRTAMERGGDAINNLSYYNQDGDGLVNFTVLTNHLNISSIAPDIENPDYRFGDPLIPGGSVRWQWMNLYRSISRQIMAKKDGNLFSRGTFDQKYYHECAADDPELPSDPSDHTKLRWFQSEKLQPSPDIGAIQYEKIFPPVLVNPGISTPSQSLITDFEVEQLQK